MADTPNKSSIEPQVLQKESMNMDRQAILNKWNSIPDMIILARRLPKYQNADKEARKLEKDYRKQNKAYQMTEKSAGDDVACSTQEHKQNPSTKRIVDAKGVTFNVPGQIEHEIRLHGAAIPENLAVFLNGLPAPDPSLDPKPLLEKWSRIPDLFDIARAEAKDGDTYAIQDKLVAEYRKAGKVFQVKTVYRGYEHCGTYEHYFVMTTQLVTNEKGESIKVAGHLRHDIEFHGASFPDLFAAFLRALPE